MNATTTMKSTLSDTTPGLPDVEHTDTNGTPEQQAQSEEATVAQEERIMDNNTSRPRTARLATRGLPLWLAVVSAVGMVFLLSRPAHACGGYMPGLGFWLLLVLGPVAFVIICLLLLYGLGRLLLWLLDRHMSARRAQ
jgi:hypothetical protein